MSGNESKPEISLGQCRSHRRKSLPKCRDKQSCIPHARRTAHCITQTGLSCQICVILRVYQATKVELCHNSRRLDASLFRCNSWFPCPDGEVYGSILRATSATVHESRNSPMGKYPLENWRRNHPCSYDNIPGLNV